MRIVIEIPDRNAEQKVPFLRLLAEENPVVLGQAYLHAKALTQMGVDISKECETATANHEMAYTAYKRGYCAGLNRCTECQLIRNSL